MPSVHEDLSAESEDECFASAGFVVHGVAILLSVHSGDCEVASRALPFDQFFSPVICSAISFDNGTNSVKTEAISRSVGSFPASNAA